MRTFTILDLEKVIANLRRRLRLLEIQGNTGVIKNGLAADRPATPTVSIGSTTSFYATDTKTLSIWNTVTEDWDEEVFT